MLRELGQAPGAGRLPPGPRRKPRTGKRLPITDDDAKLIRDIIEEWSHPKLRWADVVEVVSKRLGTAWHRQSLANHKRILAAFQAKKLELRKVAEGTGRIKRRSEDSTVAYLEHQLREATEQVVKLQTLLAQREAQLARWMQNAFLHGITIEQLDAPLQENDRGRSDRR